MYLDLNYALKGWDGWNLNYALQGKDGINA